jgi:predicted NUDIX family NTP pyrophosphohydrolase
VEIAAMPKVSAGLLLYRKRRGSLEIFLVHPGGPFWANKDDGAWSIPKGELDEGEEPLEAAKREFREETGLVAEGEYQPLEPIRQSGGKIVHAWAVQGDLQPTAVKSNTFSLEWPPGSGKMRKFPEVDRAGWFKIDVAKRKILKSQLGLLEQLENILASRE